MLADAHDQTAAPRRSDRQDDDPKHGEAPNQPRETSKPRKRGLRKRSHTATVPSRQKGLPRGLALALALVHLLDPILLNTEDWVPPSQATEHARGEVRGLGSRLLPRYPTPRPRHRRNGMILVWPTFPASTPYRGGGKRGERGEAARRMARATEQGCRPLNPTRRRWL